MTLFLELFELTRGATVALIVSSDHAAGRMTVSVVPKPADHHQENALCRDLTLEATPEEFDGQFVQALREYRHARVSLAEQARTTMRVLEAATQASAATANSKGKAKREAGKLGAPSSGDAGADSGSESATHCEAAVATAASMPQADLFE